jgi:hypothetical protein
MLIAFGSSVASSIVSVLDLDAKGGGWPKLIRTWEIAVPIALGLCFLGYVFRRTRRQSSFAVAARDRAQGRPQTSAFAGRTTGIVLALLVASLPWATSAALTWLAASRGTGYGMDSVHVADMLSAAFSLLIVAYVLSGSGRDFSALGLHWTAAQAGMAMPIFLAGTLLNQFEWPTISWVGNTFIHPGWQPPDVGAMIFGPEVTLGAVPGAIVNGFLEELIVRAYLMTELIRLTRNTWFAVVVSVAVQTSYHFYQGVPLALSHVAVFTLFALVYARTRWALTIALAHSLFDLGAVWGYGLQKLLPF